MQLDSVKNFTKHLNNGCRLLERIPDFSYFSEYFHLLCDLFPGLNDYFKNVEQNSGLKTTLNIDRQS